jgi:hypothetical protein
MTRLLIYLSFLSLPGAQELGLLNITQLYIALVLADPLVLAILKRRSLFLPSSDGSQASFLYLWLIGLFLPINFLVSQLNETPPMVWGSRSIHLALIPFFYFSFRLSRLNPETIFKDICIVGFIEAILIYVSFFMNLDSGEFRRAADIENVIVFSIFIVFAAYYSLRKYDIERSRTYLFIYTLILFATILTGTRMLMISTAFLILTFKGRSNAIKGGVLVAILLLSLSASVLFERFDLSEFDNLVTIQAKVEEVEILAEYFLNNPVLGMGFGKAYQVSLANSEYTYSHNILMFYLGYAGLIGFLIALYPLIRLFWYSGYRILVGSIFIFYTTSTTYTNVKHSILFAYILLLLDQKRLSIQRSSSEHQLVPSV